MLNDDVLGRLISLPPWLSGELEDGGGDEDFGVEERESECEMLLAPLDSVVRAERATDRRLLVSALLFTGDSLGADVGPG